ncbi:uncharacterized protein A1O5_11519 [Cladophialophora psammophila CBS 110553]|uniref:Uncharacterized protein n=1 Tax=Cladophialophora psammophila CBS 110553 TaxID=1182543 RepID=W9WEQ5_9EURO|nr:uncharacterized protein A1O5_11519 [Cladophialophora psammophila CBS 110553]EXJ63470.1 hypothetical protein A1O5_11519 [Cladophialophora psammophila CBS 110553]
MPHKHKRKRDEDDSNFDLPPTARARTLAVHQKQESIFTSDAEKKRKREAKKQQQREKKKKDSGGDFEDDTPKAFRRLMSFQAGGKRIPSGLDDGNASKRKKKEERGLKSTSKSSSTSKPDASVNNATTAAASTEPSDPPAATTAHTMPKILPGESLASFSQRVNQSLPLTSLPKHRTRLSAIPGLEKIGTPLTKHNKRLARMQKEWRATDQRLREKREEEDEELAERREEDEILWLGAGIDPKQPSSSTLKKSTTKKKKRKGGAARDVDDAADPWKILEKKRRDQGQLARQANLQDVVAAPPTLKPVKNIFKDKTERKNGMVSTM